MSELPKGWIETTLSEVSEEIDYGFTTSASRTPRGPKFLRITDIQNGVVDWETVPFCKIPPNKASRFILKSGDIVFARTGATTGKSFLITLCPEAVFASYLIRVRLAKGILPELLGHFFQSFSYWQQITENISGSAQPNCNATKLSSLRVSIPPLNEQRRIAAKLEKLLSRVDAAQARLATIPRILKRFRQSVLAAACSGRLTADWRSENSDVEPATKFLEQIIDERRLKWEAEQLENMAASGKAVKDNKWKSKYVEPVAPDTNELDDLPEGWVWGTWNQVSNWITYGFTRPMPHVSTGIPIVTAKHVVKREILFVDTDRTTEQAYEELSNKDRPKIGDILITKDGSIGRAALVETERAFCINQSVAVIWLRSLTLNKKYLLAVIEAPFTQNRILEKARGAAIQHLSITDFAKMPVPIPPDSEQQEIVRRVEALFKTADALEARYRTAKAHVDRLTQSILARAFRGELVTTEAELARRERRTYEPASVLLERIRQERAQQQQASAKSKPRRAPKSKKDARTKKMFA